MKQIQRRVNDKIKEQYDKLFHMFQSKPINEILTNNKTQTSIAYYDLKFDGDDIQYLKRYYNASESLVRILKLINYYEINLLPPHSNLIPVSMYQVMANRYRKLNKLQALKEQSLAKRRQQRQYEQDQEKTMELNSKENILQHLERENLSDIDSNGIQVESFDSDVHDIYNYNGPQFKFRLTYSSSGIESNILDIKGIKQSDLIIDFKTTSKIITSSRDFNSQYQLHNLNSNKLLNKNQTKIENEKSIFIKVASPQQKIEKRSSFIGYYNSLSKKQSSKILQQYIKEKK